LAKRNEIDVEINPNDTSLEKIVKLKNIEIILVCNWYKIISEGVIKIPKNGVYGIHNSLLPKYKGMSPLIWSALSDDTFIGSTLFRFDKGMDTGDIAKQWKIKNEDLYINEIIQKLTAKIISDLPDVFQKIINNNLKHVKQNKIHSTYCNKRIPQDSKLMWQIFNSKELLKRIRILNYPYPYNFSFLNGKKINILEADPFESPISGVPGSIFHFDNKVIACCLDGKGIEIKKVIDSEKKEIPLNELTGRFLDQPLTE
tara:strand:+ start:965 stop:1735 length:771 start_codon:yes stop_codon:yes gene_type:complete